MKYHTEEEIQIIHRRMTIGAAVASVFWVCIGAAILAVSSQVAVEWGYTMDGVLVCWFLLPVVLFIVAMIGLMDKIGR